MTYRQQSIRGRCHGDPMAGFWHVVLYCGHPDAPAASLD